MHTGLSNQQFIEVTQQDGVPPNVGDTVHRPVVVKVHGEDAFEFGQALDQKTTSRASERGRYDSNASRGRVRPNEAKKGTAIEPPTGE